MAAKTSAAKKKAGSGGRSAKKTTSGVKAVHSTKPSSRTTSKTTAHKKNGSGSTSKASRTGTNTYRRRTIEEMNEYQDHIAFEQGMTILLNCAVLVLCYVSFFGLAGQFGAVIKNIFMKLFGWTAWMIPMAIVLAVIFSIVNPGDKRVPRRIASGTVIVLALMGLTGSGIVGKYIDLGVFRVLGEVGGYCVLGALLLVSIYIFYGIEWMAMLRKRNAYYQEMGEAYEVIRQEEDYTEPSYKVRPPKRRKIYSDHQMQSVNLQQMNEQIDRMQEKEQEVTEVKSLMIKRVDRVELVLKKLAQLLANNTNYAAMISGPQYHQNKLKFIQLSRMEENKLLVVIVVEGNLIKNAMVNVPESVSQEDILNLNILLNSALNGLTIEQINLDVITKLKQQAGVHSQIVDLVLNEVAGAIRADEEDLQIYTSGATNIFKYPELSDGEKASQLISTLEQKDKLQELIADVNESEDSNGIQVYIGDETPLQTMKDCSVVTANYELGEGIRGTIGIIGPKRMDYERVLSTLKHLMKQLDATYKNES